MTEQSQLKETKIYREPRPVLLTVLCILTFIGSSWTIVSSGWLFYTAPKTSAMVDKNLRPHNLPDSVDYDDGGNRGRKFQKNMFRNFFSKFNEKAIRYSAAGAILASLFTLGGAILMWRGNRVGFYTYIAGIAISMIVPLVVYGSSLLSAGMAVSAGLPGLVFVALYALNLRWLGKRNFQEIET